MRNRARLACLALLSAAAIVSPLGSRTSVAPTSTADDSCGVVRSSAAATPGSLEVPVGAICARFGLSRYQLRQAYLKGGWRKRLPIADPGPHTGGRPRSPR